MFIMMLSRQGDSIPLTGSTGACFHNVCSSCIEVEKVELWAIENGAVRVQSCELLCSDLESSIQVFILLLLSESLNR